MTASPAKDPSGPIRTPEQPADSAALNQSAAALSGFCAVLAVLWCLFFWLSTTFPYIQSGAEAVYRAKTRMLQRGLDANLVIFGNSKVLSGFKPALFDQLAGVRSFNLGLPDETQFIDNLESLAARGKPPRTVLLTLTQSNVEHKPTLFRYLDSDRAIIDRLFPFHHFPRDLIMFLVRSGTRGGPLAFYHEGKAILARMESDRGYYFIENQSPFPEHVLPAGSRLPTDRPDSIDTRTSFRPPDLTRLRALAQRHGIEIWIVPTYHRPGEYAPAPAENADLANMLRGDSRLHLAGPDYWILPTDCFADYVHLNPHGAEVYTRRLAELLGSAHAF